MKGIKYELTIYGGLLEFTHGFGQKIEEIYLPDKNLSFNYQGAFEPDEDRYKEDKKIGEVKVSNSDVKILKTYLYTKETAKKVLNKYFPQKKGYTRPPKAVSGRNTMATTKIVKRHVKE